MYDIPQPKISLNKLMKSMAVQLAFLQEPIISATVLHVEISEFQLLNGRAYLWEINNSSTLKPFLANNENTRTRTQTRMLMDAS